LSSRVSFALAVLLLLLAAVLRFWALSTLPPGLHDGEVTDIFIAETVREGQVRVLYDNGADSREELYHTILAVVTGFVGKGLIGYRILSVWVGLLTLALVYALAIRLFNPLAALGALAALTVSMWPVLLARQVARETLLPLLVTAALLALAIAFSIYKRRRIRVPSTTAFAVLGALLGLGFYVHPAGYIIALFSMVFIAYMLLSSQPVTRQTLGYIGFSILLMVIIAMPYLISSIRLPHLAGAGRLLGGYTVAQTPPLQAIGDSITGIFFEGDANPVRNVPGRPLVDLISGMLMLVGLLTALRYWQKPRFLLLLITVLVLAPVALLTVDGANFLSFSAILPLLALFFGLGMSTLMRSSQGIGRWVGSLGLGGLLLFNTGWTVRDLFQVWPKLPDVQQAYHGRLMQLAHHLDLTAETVPSVVCTSRLMPARRLPDLSDLQLLEMMMHRSDAPLRFADCGTGLVMVQGGSEEQIILLEPNTLSTMHPYLADWMLNGEALVDPALPSESVIRLDVSSELADVVGRFTTTAPAGFAPEAPGSEDLAAPPVHFGNNLTFLGYERAASEIFTPGGDLTFITYWRADGPLPPDLLLFTHILADPAALPIAQTDTISVSAGELEDRDVFIQITFVTLPFSTPPGVYNISVGAYRADSGGRLPVLDGNQIRGTRLFLGQIVVQQN
jgi:hypothetical protein